MPRIRQKAEEYAMKDLVGEINAQSARYGHRTQAALGDALGVCQATAGGYLKKPESIRLDVLRRMVKVLRLDPVIVLKALGYSQREINDISKKGRTEEANG